MGSVGGSSDCPLSSCRIAVNDSPPSNAGSWRRATLMRERRRVAIVTVHAIEWSEAHIANSTACKTSATSIGLLFKKVMRPSDTCCTITSS